MILDDEKRKYPFLALMISLLIMLHPGDATGLRTLKEGDSINDYELTLLSDGSTKKLSGLSGEKGLLVIFWATWSERSQEILKFADQTLMPRYKSEGIGVIGINIESQELSADERESIDQTVSELNLSFPLAIDHGLVLFDEIGVITNPTTLLIDPNLVLQNSFPGFPSIARDEIPALLNEFLGIEEEQPSIRDRYLLAHNPKNKALLRYNLGRNLLKRYLSSKGELQHPPQGVIKQLDIATERDPDFYRPYMLKAIIYHMSMEEEKKASVLAQIEEKQFKEQVEMIDLAFMYMLIGKGDYAEELLLTLKSDIPEESEVMLLDGLIMISGKRDDDASIIFKNLTQKEKAKKTLPFDIGDFLEGETGRLKGDPDKTSRLLAEQILNISKK